MTKREMIKSLRELVTYSNLLLDRLRHHGNIDPVREEGPIEDLDHAVTEAERVLAIYDMEEGGTLEGYPYLPLDKIPGYKELKD